MIKRVRTLRLLKDMGEIESPEFNKRKAHILDEGNLGKNIGKRKERKRPLFGDNSNSGDEDEGDSEQEEPSVIASTTHFKVLKDARRLKRKTDVLTKFEKNCKCVVWLHMEGDTFTELKVPFEFISNDGVFKY